MDRCVRRGIKYSNGNVNKKRTEKNRLAPAKAMAMSG